jgi:hypothetical protein
MLFQMVLDTAEIEGAGKEQTLKEIVVICIVTPCSLEVDTEPDSSKTSGQP